jgi:hypothetical protein
LERFSRGDLVRTRVDSSASSVDVVADVSRETGLCGDDSGDLPFTERCAQKDATLLEEGNVVEDCTNEAMWDIEVGHGALQLRIVEGLRSSR